MENGKFKVIEEGRLTSSEMNEVYGGYVCFGGTLGMYKVYENCGENTTGKYSSCLSTYRSCTDDAFLNCIGSYEGPTGPDGYIDSMLIF